MHAHVHVYVHVYVHAHVHVYVYAHVYVHAHVHVYVYVYAYVYDWSLERWTCAFWKRASGFRGSMLMAFESFSSASGVFWLECSAIPR